MMIPFFGQGSSHLGSRVCVHTLLQSEQHLGRFFDSCLSHIHVHCCLWLDWVKSRFWLPNVLLDYPWWLLSPWKSFRAGNRILDYFSKIDLKEQCHLCCSLIFMKKKIHLLSRRPKGLLAFHFHHWFGHCSAQFDSDITLPVLWLSPQERSKFRGSEVHFGIVTCQLSFRPNSIFWLLDRCFFWYQLSTLSDIEMWCHQSFGWHLRRNGSS